MPSHSVQKCWLYWTDGAGVGCSGRQIRRSQILTFPPCTGLFSVASCQRDQCALLSYTWMLQKCWQCIDPYCNSYCHSADRSPSPSGSPQSSPRPSPRQHHRRDHSKGEIPVGSCKEYSPLDKSDILEVSNSVCLFVCLFFVSDWGIGWTAVPSTARLASVQWCLHSVIILKFHPTALLSCAMCLLYLLLSENLYPS